MKIHYYFVSKIQWQFIKNISFLNPNESIILGTIFQMPLNLIFKILAYIHLITVLIHNGYILLERSFLNVNKLKHTSEHSNKIGIKSNSEEHIQNRQNLLYIRYAADIPISYRRQRNQRIIDAQQIQMEITVIFL